MKKEEYDRIKGLENQLACERTENRLLKELNLELQIQLHQRIEEENKLKRLFFKEVNNNKK